MKKLLLLLIAFLVVNTSFAQHFFDTDFNTRKKYIILCDPSVHRIKTIQYLTDHNILKVNKNKVKFVGVYYEGQTTDFSETQDYIEENKLDNFFLHEITGELNETNLFQENDVTAQLKKVFDNSIGIIFFGGADIPPAIYGEENTKCGVYTPARHYYESTFIFHLLGGYQNESFKPFLAERPDYVVTGFCLGMQTMNVGTGGTMIQDIPAEIYHAETPKETVAIGRANMHRNYWQLIEDDSLFMGINLHTIQFTDNPFFGTAIKISKKATPRICSSHHQAIEKLGKGLEVTCLSPDGKIIEGIVHSTYPHVFAVQFHPEVSALYEDMDLKIFHPDDEPKTYHDILGKSDVKFHKDYWKHISDSFKDVKKPKRN
ncbi:gamma-glutamyl-gamma-aminobutyrate hydrolase family protein [Draconibacterium halophilum]|uniref:Uncharacterized protein n=1 Tax=Draconibacterium halophilum TaxID=2706887 RepID=A0A6C0RC09_9BACT|nr:gamma-glutamyl-gamma-aminobutyrate hydrolase family protein [Draconibacterium halophilum]QIA07860.1 hypothetical protein G0Q07_09040 [Draconibacterium halophilum]